MSNYMIHINDLSVGDWVYIPLPRSFMTAEALYPIKVTSIRENDVALYVKWPTHEEIESEKLSVENISPIPITPEILEQNGCTLAWHYRGALKYECEAFSATQERDRWTIACNDIVATIQYVHQLQHLLRIAGATKEINL